MDNNPPELPTPGSQPSDPLPLFTLNTTQVIRRVAFQGEHGAFSEAAIRQIWPENVTTVPCLTFIDTVASVLNREVDVAVIPVHNAIAGPVEPAVEAISAAGERVRECGETQVLIRHCLMASPGTSLEHIRAVFSHPMALAQCGQFFVKHPWLTATVHADTAGAARDVALWSNPTRAAIASEIAAAHYQLEILARDIQDIADNWTRFVVVTSTRQPTT